MVHQDRILILYGSQTGTAQEMAENIWRQSRVHGLKGPIMAMDDYKIEGLIRERFVIFVCSTTGIGEEPDNMKQFWKFLLRKSLPTTSLCNLNFAVLGLGDSSYSKFNFPAKKLHKRLTYLGGTSLVDVGLCDYQHDLGHDGVFDPWICNLWDKLKQYFPSITTVTTGMMSSSFIPRWNISCLGNTNDMNGDSGQFKDLYFSGRDSDHLQEKPFVMCLDKNIRTTAEDHFQDVRLLSFKPDNEAFSAYTPGDVLNVRPRNSKENVAEFFDIFGELLKINPQTYVNISQHDPGISLNNPI